MEESTKKPKLFLQTCQSCGGSGLIMSSGENTAECQVCSGRGLIGFAGGEFLFWGKRIDGWSILQARLHKSVKLVINVILIIFGVVGLIFGLLELFKYLQDNALNLAQLHDYFIGRTSLGKTIFSCLFGNSL